MSFDMTQSALTQSTLDRWSLVMTILLAVYAFAIVAAVAAWGLAQRQRLARRAAEHRADSARLRTALKPGARP